MSAYRMSVCGTLLVEVLDETFIEARHQVVETSLVQSKQADQIRAREILHNNMLVGISDVIILY